MSNHNIRVDAIGLAAEVVELRNEIARLKNQTNWVCSCGGTDCEGQKENADLRNTLDAVIWADERGVELWRAAHPGKELVIPDRTELVVWLLEQNAALRAHAERVGQANDQLVVENAALRKELDWKTERLKLLSDCLHKIDGFLKQAATSVFVDALDAARNEAQP